MKNKGKFAIIGAGFSGLSSAALLAKEGHDVTVIEKNASVGGRARSWEMEGFIFDMGPSWYWMPDVFESIFEKLGSSVAKQYDLIRLDPAFRIIFPGREVVDVPGTCEGVRALFDKLEPGAGKAFDNFIEEGRQKYELGVKKLAYKPARSILEFLDLSLFRKMLRLNLLGRFDKYVARSFKDQRLRMIMHFPVLFLGTLPRTTPALYSFMNFSGLAQGTWYPKGGMIKVVKGLEAVASELGASFRFNTTVRSIKEEKGKFSLETSQGPLEADGVVASADYHHVESELLSSEKRKHSASYWESRDLAPSALIFYLGISKRVNNLLHHTLFFDTSFDAHAESLYEAPKWPKDPLIYVCCPSKTDSSVAPKGCENLFVLIPIAAGLPDSPDMREDLFQKAIDRIESFTGDRIRDSIIVKRSYCIDDFKKDYNAFRGNAYGLANTLRQTAFGKPPIVPSAKNRLVFSGQMTVPGPGVPPALISGQIAASELLKLWEAHQ